MSLERPPERLRQHDVCLPLDWLAAGDVPPGLESLNRLAANLRDAFAVGYPEAHSADGYSFDLLMKSSQRTPRSALICPAQVPEIIRRGVTQVDGSVVGSHRSVADVRQYNPGLRAIGNGLRVPFRAVPDLSGLDQEGCAAIGSLESATLDLGSGQADLREHRVHEGQLLDSRHVETD